MFMRLNKAIVARAKAAEYKRLLEIGTYPKKNKADTVIQENVFDYSPAQKQRLFEAMQENFLRHYTYCEYYQKRCIREGFGPNDLKVFEDIWRIPYILSDVFKYYDISTRSGLGIKINFSSSGTSGKKSWVIYNVLTGRRILFLN